MHALPMQKAGVELEFMMIDESKAEICALQQLKIHYLLCKFHMNQDWEKMVKSTKSGVPDLGPGSKGVCIDEHVLTSMCRLHHVGKESEKHKQPLGSVSIPLFCWLPP